MVWCFLLHPGVGLASGELDVWGSLHRQCCEGDNLWATACQCQTGVACHCSFFPFTFEQPGFGVHQERVKSCRAHAIVGLNRVVAGAVTLAVFSVCSEPLRDVTLAFSQRQTNLSENLVVDSIRRNCDTEPFPCPRWSWAPTVVLLSFLVKSLKCTFVYLSGFSISACTFSLTAFLQFVHCCLAATSTQENVSFRCSMENLEIRHPCHPMAGIRGISCWQISALSAGVGFIYHMCSSPFCVDKNESEFWKKMNQRCAQKCTRICSIMH